MRCMSGFCEIPSKEVEDEKELKDLEEENNKFSFRGDKVQVKIPIETGKALYLNDEIAN